MIRFLALLLLLGGCLTVVVASDPASGALPSPSAPQGRVVDELFLPADRDRPTTGTVALAVGRTYEVTVDGTYSAYVARQWRSVCAGRPEPAPRYTRDGQSGPVGRDPSYFFAFPNGSSACGLAVPARQSAWYYRLTRAGDWHAGATDAPYNPDHVYSTRVVGEGSPFAAVVYDVAGEYGDNYGGLRVVVRDVGQ